jgi:hypothetical protein
MGGKMKNDMQGNQPVTIDGASLHVLPTPQVIHLKTADDVRLEMGKVYREMRQGKIESGEGTKLVYVLGQIGKVIELVEIEKRIALLERAIP